MTRRSRALCRHGATSRGQALVEFALILPLLVFLLLGLFDFGRAVYAFSTVNNAARDGARLAVVDQTESHVQALAAQRAASLGIDPDDVAMEFHQKHEPGTPCEFSPGQMQITDCVAVVEIPYTYTAITPLIGNLVGTIDMTGEARFPVSHSCLDPEDGPPAECPEGD